VETRKYPNVFQDGYDAGGARPGHLELANVWNHLRDAYDGNLVGAPDDAARSDDLAQMIGPHLGSPVSEGAVILAAIGCGFTVERMDHTPHARIYAQRRL
jgi:hypothetical protein